MNAVISGTAGVALLIDGSKIFSIDVDDVGKTTPRRKEDLHFLFGNQRNLQFLEDVSREEAVKELQLAQKREDALDIALILMDSTLPDDIREEAAQELETLFDTAGMREYLEGILYAKPLPPSADIQGGLSCCVRTKRWSVYMFIEALRQNQPHIREVSLYWEAIPDEAFEGRDHREEFFSQVMRQGLCRSLALTVSKGGSVGQFLVHSLTLSPIKRLHNHRNVLQQWVSSFRGEKTKPPLEAPQEPRVSDARYEDKQRKKPKDKGRKAKRVSYDRHDVSDKIDRQKEAIIIAMRRRDLSRMHEFLNDLIEYNLAHGSEKHACMSLCSLAMEAKDLGMYPLQLSLTEWALKLDEYDVRSQTQHADALLRVNRLDEALVVYEKVIKDNPRDVVAKNGRAEVLKSLNRLDDSLTAYDEVIQLHPEDVVAKTGRAEVLKSLNRLNDSLTAYEEVTREHPENVVAKTGRAEVLKSLNRLDEAAFAYQQICKNHPYDEYARNGLVCTLAASGKYQEALAILPQTKPQTYQEWIAYHIRGMILLAQEHFDEAIDIFREGQRSNPMPASRDFFRTALAVAYLRKRDFQAGYDLLKNEETTELSTPANLLLVHCAGELGKKEEALEAYNKLPANPIPAIAELQNEIYLRYILLQAARHTEDWMFKNEIRMMMILFAACAMLQQRSSR